jgi:plastocyanin
MNKKITAAIITVLVLSAIGLQVLRPQEQPKNRPYLVSSGDVPADVTINMTDEGFSPGEASIKVGQTVKFVNDADPSCNPQSPDCNFWPASNPHPTHEIYPEFDPREPIAPGEAWMFVFDRAGDWGFHDHFHYTNRGIVHVTKP